MKRSYLIGSLVILWIHTVIVTILSTLHLSNNLTIRFELFKMFDVFVLNSFMALVSIFVYKSIAKPDRQSFIWFVLYCIIRVFLGVGYLLLCIVLDVESLNQFISNKVGLIPIFLESTVLLIYYILLIKGRLKIQQNWFIWLLIVLIDCCLLYISLKFNLKIIHDKSLRDTIFQVYFYITAFVTFSLASYVLISAINIGIKLIAIGIVGETGIAFINSYAVNFLDKYSYDLAIFFISLLITGLINLVIQKNYSQFSGFVRGKSIKSVITAWVLCSVIFTMFLSIILANYMGIMTPQIKSILPYIIFMYMIFAVFISFIIAYILERSIKQINQMVQSFITKPINSQTSSSIEIDEFSALNDVFVYTMNLVVEKNKKEELNKLAAQVAHDIASPLFAISTVIPACDVLPEDQRTLLRLGIERISGIANHLLSRYAYKSEDQENVDKDLKLSTLVSTNLMEIVAEKKYEYKYSIVEIKLDVNPTDNVEFIGLDSSSFKRMMSNIINNAIDAIGNKAGIINISFEVVDNHLMQIVVKDNGSGMSAELINKIMDKIEVSEGKDSGHGIGFIQIQDTLEKGYGKLSIQSKVGEGTVIILSIPTVEKPDWISNEINLNFDDIVIILDDDSSIHGAWDTKLSSEAPNITLKHFTLGREVIDYVNSLSEGEKNKIFLLTDFELLRQGINGLQIIKQLQIKRAILVTSHYADVKLQQETLAAGSRVLPKVLAFSTLINVRN